MGSRALVVLLLAACAARPLTARFPDAPLELRDDADRDQAIDQLWALPDGPARDAIRADIARAIAHRLADALDEDHPYDAQDLLFELLALWRDDPAAAGAGLAPELPVIRRARATFAKSGASEPVIGALVALAEIDPSHRAAYVGELDEVLSFADELAVDQDGPDAVRARPIELLRPTVLALPVPWLVDRYVGLLEARQRAIVELIAKRGATIELVAAHHDILETARRIAIALARAGRASEIAAHLDALHGLGMDRALAARAEIVAEQPTADAYAELARALRTDEHAPDPAAALAVELAGLAKFPHDPALLAAAAGDATTIGRIDQPIALYEDAVQATRGPLDPQVALHLGELYARRIARLGLGGRPGAADQAWADLRRYTAHAPGPSDVWTEVAALGEAALGRGLASQGQLDRAEHALVRSLGRARSIDAYELLAKLAFETDRLDDAARYAAAGLQLLGQSRNDSYRRARLDRLAGDVMRAGGQPRRAAGLYLDAIRAWASLGADKDLPRNVAGERRLDEGRVLWYLGDAHKSVELVLDALDVDPDSPETCAAAVEFLLDIGRRADAVDALHRALDADVPELTKVYLSLWIAADARHRGVPHDREATAYLASRHGDLWYERLAEAASGRLSFEALRAAASTAPRQAELAFYGAMLGIDPRARTPAGERALLEDVVRARMVTDAEYDFARRYLAAP